MNNKDIWNDFFFFFFLCLPFIRLYLFCINKTYIWNRAPARYVRSLWPRCWWSFPSSSSWLHRLSSLWASRLASSPISSSTAASTTFSYYLTWFSWNSVWSTAAASTSSSTSWGRPGFAKNCHGLRVSGFWSRERQDWRKRGWVWTQWQQECRLCIAQKQCIERLASAQGDRETSPLGLSTNHSVSMSDAI